MYAVSARLDRITIVESSGQRAPLNRVVLRGKLISGQLMIIEGRVGRVPVKAVIDTGGLHALGNATIRNTVITYGDFDVFHVCGLQVILQDPDYRQIQRCASAAAFSIPST